MRLPAPCRFPAAVDRGGGPGYDPAMFTLEYTEGVLEDFKGLRATDRKRILDRIEDQLQHSPTRPTRNKKMLIGLKPP